MCTKYIFVFFISDSRGVSVVFVSLEDNVYMYIIFIYIYSLSFSSRSQLYSGLNTNIYHFY